MKTRSQGELGGDKSIDVINKKIKIKTKTKQQEEAKPKPMKKKKKKKKKRIMSRSPNPTADDLKKPKKPPTAFFYYLEDFRKIYQAENPGVKSMRDIGKACGEKWKTMTFEEKVQYYDIATEKRAEYEKAIAAYIKRKKSGELSEESDEEYE